MKYSPEYKEEILNYLRAGHSIRNTAKFFQISPQTVINMKHSHYKVNPKKPGKKPSYGKHEVLLIKKWINSQLQSGSLVNSRSCLEHLELNLKIHTVRRIINSLGYTYDEVERKLPLSKEHKDTRVKWAKKHLESGFDFSQVVFTDEKRFSMDGPDGFMSYGKPGQRVHRIKRQNRGGGVMVWGAITSDGSLFVYFIDGKYNGERYAGDLKKIILPWCKAKFRKKTWYFQQDNCTIHKERKFVMPTFTQNKVKLLEWPSRSPDLNPIENIWYMMGRELYQKGQFKSKNELKRAIDLLVEQFNTEKKQVIKNLFNGMNHRLVQVIVKKGNVINEKD